MKLQFAEGETGFYEAQDLRNIARHVLSELDPNDFNVGLVTHLEHLAEEHMLSDEFAELRMLEYEEDSPSISRKMRTFLGQLTGPSERELELGRQRSVAIGRAQRAEHASFETIAENAKLSQEKQEAHNKISQLEQKIDELQRLIDKLQERNFD